MPYSTDHSALCVPVSNTGMFTRRIAPDKLTHDDLRSLACTISPSEFRWRSRLFRNASIGAVFPSRLLKYLYFYCTRDKAIPGRTPVLAGSWTETSDYSAPRLTEGIRQTWALFSFVVRTRIHEPVEYMKPIKASNPCISSMARFTAHGQWP